MTSRAASSSLARVSEAVCVLTMPRDVRQITHLTLPIFLFATRGGSYLCGPNCFLHAGLSQSVTDITAIGAVNISPAALRKTLAHCTDVGAPPGNAKARTHPAPRNQRRNESVASAEE